MILCVMPNWCLSHICLQPTQNSLGLADTPQPWRRAVAYEAVGLSLAALVATSPKLTQQVQVLLEGLKRSLTQPFQRLPAVIAMFAAEAVFVLMAPGSAMYSPVNKLLLKGPVLNLEVEP